MDSSYLSPYKNVFRASSESQRLARINATPYDNSFNDSNASITSTASQKLVSFFKDKMSGVVTGLKGFFNPNEKPLLSSVVLTNSVTLPYIPPGKLNSISAALQDTMKKPEYQDKYNFSLNSSMVDSRKSSVQNVMKFYKDVSVDKVREKIQRQDSKALDLSVSCAVKPKALYSSVNTSLNSSRLDQGKNDLNVHGKRELRSILHDQNKPSKGSKKVSFVPELRRSASSIIKYTSSDDEEGTFVEDQKQKKLFANSTKIFIKPQTLNVSVIPTRKLKVNPFQKKILEKSSQPKSHKLAKKQFPEDFARKFNHENSFGSDNLVNDSKLETDSDESNLHQNTFDHKNFINSLAAKKKSLGRKSSNDYDSSSEIESPKEIVAQIPVEEEEDDEIEEVDIDAEESNYEEEKQQIPVEEPVKKVQEPAKTSLFGNLNTTAAPVTTEKKPTENNTPKLGGGLFANLTPAPAAIAETKKETTTEAPKSSLFASFNNTASPVSAPKETTSTSLFGGNTETTKPAVVEAPKPSSSGLFGGNSLFGASPSKTEETKPAVVEAPKEVQAEKPAPIARSDSQVHSIFANLNRSGSTVSNTNNPFLSAASQPKPVNFSSLIGGGGASSAEENKPAEQQQQAIVESQPQNNDTTMESNNNNQPVAEPAAPKLGGFLGLISQNNNQGSMFSNTLNTSTNYSWMSTENNEQKSNNLFGGMSNNQNNNQSSMFTQNASVNPFSGGSGGMNFENGMENNNNNNNSMFGGNSGFGNNNSNNNNSGNPFTGGGGLSRQGSSMNNGLFGNNNGGSSNGMFGNNSGSGGSMENNPFLSNQNSSFGGNSGGFSGGFGGSSGNSNNFMGSGGGSFGSAKKGKQKERAF